MTSSGVEERLPRRSVGQVVLHAPAPVKVLVVGVFVVRAGSFFATFATLFLSHRGFAARELPLVLVLVGVAGMLGSLAGGWLADRVGHRRSLVASMVASSFAVALLAFAPNHPVIVVAVCLVAVCSQSYTPAASALLIAHSDPAERVPIFAFFRLAINVGVTIGALIAGFVATRSFTALFGIEAIAYASCALVLYVGLRRAEPRVDPAVVDAALDQQATAEPIPPAPETVRHRPVWLLCIALCAIAVVYSQYQSTLPLQLVQHGFSTAFYGTLLAVNGFVVILFELPVSSLTRRAAWVVPLIGGILLMTTGLVVTALVTAALAAVIAFVGFTAGEMVFAPVCNAAVAELSPTGTEARYQGLLATAQSLGFSFGPAIGTAVFARSHDGLWLFTVAVSCLFCAGIYAIWRLAKPGIEPAGAVGQPV